MEPDVARLNESGSDSGPSGSQITFERNADSTHAARSPLDVIIVTHNGRALVQDCLDSLRAEAELLPLNVTVVDNDSTDGLVELIRSAYGLEAIATGGNLGFGKAANIGIQQTNAELVLLLNPDTVVPKGALVACVEALRARPWAGMLGCKLVRLDGSIDHACKRHIPTPLSALAYFARVRGRRFPSSYTADSLSYDDEGVVGAINGAFMLVRRAAIQDVGLFDEAYWMYGEDLDWCYRFDQHGWPVVYWPHATVIHVKAGISGTRRSARLNFAFHQAMWIFYMKHFKSSYRAYMAASVFLAIWLKFSASLATNALVALATHLSSGRGEPTTLRCSGDA